MVERPHTDLNKLVKEEVVSHMRPFIDVTMQEHEKTRQEIKSAVKIMKMASVNRINIVLLWVIDALILGAMLIFHI